MPWIRNQKFPFLMVVNCSIFNALRRDGLSFSNNIKNKYAYLYTQITAILLSLFMVLFHGNHIPLNSSCKIPILQ